MTAFATIEDLLARLDWDPSDKERAMYEAALEDASELVRVEGRNWTVENAPPLARTITLAAVVRYARNPDAYTQSRAGDESVSWADGSGGLSLTANETGLLKRIVRPGGLTTVPMVAWGSKPQAPETVYLPVDGHKPVPHAGPSDWP